MTIPEPTTRHEPSTPQQKEHAVTPRPSTPPARRRPLLRRPLLWTLVAAGVVIVVVAALLFEPWTAVVDRRVDEDLPGAASTSAHAVPGAPVGRPEPTGRTIARGELISHEHTSSGSVLLLELPGGSRMLRLQDLDTSDGPLLHVWLTDAPVIPGTEGWYVFDDGRHVDLGALKGNIGSSNYSVPAEVDLTGLSSVTIWCDRFSVSFAAAELS